MSAALVLMMTGPGLALFYGGLVRRKNTLAIMMQSFAMMGLISVLWALVGYSLAFGGNGPVIGGFRTCILARCGRRSECRLCGDHSATDIHDLPADVRDHYAGADHGCDGGTDEVQRDRSFSDTVVVGRVRAAGAHGVGQGRVPECGARRKIPVLDFAGGTVVHITSGVSALVCALYLGKRTGFPKQPMPPHIWC